MDALLSRGPLPCWRIRPGQIMGQASCSRRPGRVPPPHRTDVSVVSDSTEPRPAAVTKALTHQGSLSGKAIIIAGAATGIGATTARRMASDGAHVIVADINRAGAEEVVASIRDLGGEATPVWFDAADRDSVEVMIAESVAVLGRLDGLFANAADLSPGTIGPDSSNDLGTLPLDVWDRTLAVNLTGAMLCCRYAIPEMIRGGGGSIVLTASIAGTAGEPVRGAYTVAKHGIIGLARHLSAAYGPKGIRTNAIAPGVVYKGGEQSAMVSFYEQITPIRKPLTTADIAETVVFLISDASSMIAGQTLTIDGGILSVIPQA